MNVDDIAPKTVVGDRLIAIFEAQHELALKYLPIEIANGTRIHTSIENLDLDNRYAQAQIKDFCWRVTEELAESTEAQILHNDVPMHAREEIADALHFMIELCIMCGVSPDVFTPPTDGEDRLGAIMRARPPYWRVTPYQVIEQLGIAANMLKNKPWKQTHVLTDQPRFRHAIKEALIQLLWYASFVGITPDEMCSLYFKKNAVNKWRQGSNY